VVPVSTLHCIRFLRIRYSLYGTFRLAPQVALVSLVAHQLVPLFRMPLIQLSIVTAPDLTPSSINPSIYPR
jgi:hypothetical protein